ncbi:hypothetical protein D3C73_1284440 [compost metagenome]
MHLQTHRGDAFRAPALAGVLPTEVVDTHALHAIAEDSVRIFYALGAVVRVAQGMGKHSGRRLKMVERADLPGRGRGCSDIQGWRNGVQPIDEYRLHVDVSVGDDDILRRQQGEAS